MSAEILSSFAKYSNIVAVINENRTACSLRVTEFHKICTLIITLVKRNFHQMSKDWTMYCLISN